jgi:hypothetical protein
MADVRRGKGPAPDITAHVRGINSGNSKGNYDKNGGHLPDGRRTARASTGVNPAAHEPIDPSMPNLSPA